LRTPCVTTVDPRASVHGFLEADLASGDQRVIRAGRHGILFDLGGGELKGNPRYRLDQLIRARGHGQAAEVMLDHEVR